ncbi:MAG: hypothetical protein ACRDMZ_23975, partial [Solirubrobacteraceae bacterium]
PTAAAETAPNGLARLNWKAPASGGVSFYRIYRDNPNGGAFVEYGDRHDRTNTAVETYTDSQSAAGPHDYWVTAVDSSFNESSPLGPITWPAP